MAEPQVASAPAPLRARRGWLVLASALAAVVVSDDASPTPYPEAHDPRLTVVRRERNGGFGAAPKFPNTMTHDLLLVGAAHDVGGLGANCADTTLLTLQRMREGVHPRRRPRVEAVGVVVQLADEPPAGHGRAERPWLAALHRPVQRRQHLGHAAGQQRVDGPVLAAREPAVDGRRELPRGQARQHRQRLR